MPKMMGDGSSPAAGIGPERPPRSRPLAKDDRVTVYEDPITRDRPEGEAVLARRLPGDLDQEWERWDVRFGGETDAYERWVHVEDRIGG